MDSGQADGATTAAALEIRELKRNVELEQTCGHIQGSGVFECGEESTRNVP